MNKIVGLLICILVFCGCRDMATQPVTYGTGQWDKLIYGNHRAVVEVAKNADAVMVRIPWRRRDANPENKKIIIIDADANTPVENIKAVRITGFAGELIFEPNTVPGRYYIYYMPYRLIGKWYHPTTVYLKPQYKANPDWLKTIEEKLQKKKSFPQAQLIEIQAVNDFHRFDPMEVVATETEARELLKNYSDRDYLIFPEDRKYPIRMNNHLPLRWIEHPPTRAFSGTARPYEYYCLQLGLYAFQKDIKDVSIDFGILKNDQGDCIEPSALTCFNLGGTDYLGHEFTKLVNVPQGKIQPLWIGIDIPKNANGTYRGILTVGAENAESQRIDMELDVTGPVLADRGDSEIWRHSRLRWLNSTIGIDDDVFAGYPPVERNSNTVSILGRDVMVGEEGLPAQIVSHFADTLDGFESPGIQMLTSPMQFVVQTTQGPVAFETGQLKFTKQKPGLAAWQSQRTSPQLEQICKAKIECDGHLDCFVTFKAKEDIELSDIYLEVPMQKEIATYMMGMKYKGGYRPTKWQWDWKAKTANNMLWMGAVNAGLHLNLRHVQNVWELGSYHAMGTPKSWANADKGGCTITETDDSVMIKAYSGPRSLKAGEEVVFRFSVLVTPFKLLNPDHWRWRYCHDYHDLWPLENVVESGAKIINIHQGNELNPYINYPFLTVDKMKAYVDKAKRMGIERLKIYDTVRELSNHMVELWAIRSLNGEVFRLGGGFQLADHFEPNTPEEKLISTGGAWLREHLIEGYVPAWHDPQEGIEDEAIASTGLSRWHNYYLEGLSWLIRNAGIDGLYLDGIGYDREVMKRLRKTMDRAKPGCLLDFHSGNGFNATYSFINPACLYMEHFPMVDSLWFGEGFEYNHEPPDYWLVEVSGIPYGLFGEMLHLCGNPWRGMIYGMSSRLRWGGCDPRAIWKVWDDFGIEQAQMIGYWSNKCPVRTDQKDVTATAYVRENKILIVLASWAEEPVQCTLEIDWDGLGLDSENVNVVMPEMDRLQQQRTLMLTEPLRIEPLKGAFTIVEQNGNGGIK